MTTMLEESFNRRCNVTDSVDYGYSGSRPDDSNGNPYGYGDGAPSPLTDPYGYGDTSGKGVDKYGCPIDATAKYGYGDTGHGGYGSEYGYGDGAPHDTAKYGYGDEPHNGAAKYGYGDASPQDEASMYGYGDGSPDGRSSHGGPDDSQPHQRPRRRNSVTRYSIVAQDAVKQEFVAHANVIDQFRQGLDSSAALPPVAQSEEHVSCDGNSEDGHYDDGADHPSGNKDKSKKKRRGLGRFRLGRHSSKDSAK